MAEAAAAKRALTAKTRERDALHQQLALLVKQAKTKGDAAATAQNLIDIEQAQKRAVEIEVSALPGKDPPACSAGRLRVLSVSLLTGPLATHVLVRADCDVAAAGGRAA